MEEVLQGRGWNENRKINFSQDLEEILSVCKQHEAIDGPLETSKYDVFENLYIFRNEKIFIILYSAEQTMNDKSTAIQKAIHNTEKKTLD